MSNEGVLSITGIFDNCNVRSNGSAKMSFKFPYSEVAKYVNFVTLVGKPIKCNVMPSEYDENIKLGSVMFERMSIDKDGEAKVTLTGESAKMEVGKIYNMLEQVVSVKLKVQDE